jgi:hypothetical protein
MRISNKILQLIVASGWVFDYLKMHGTTKTKKKKKVVSLFATNVSRFNKNPNIDHSFINFTYSLYQ